MIFAWIAQLSRHPKVWLRMVQLQTESEDCEMQVGEVDRPMLSPFVPSALCTAAYNAFSSKYMRPDGL